MPAAVGFLTLALAAAIPGIAQAQQFAVDPAITRLVEPGDVVATDPDDAVIEGFRLFTRETFGGNGRTCATCHPASHNFTIDPAFIRTLSRRDPLFVAQRKRQLRNLEIPLLMRRRGLILENLDGFERPGVMRSVQHILGLSRSVANTSDDFPLPGDEALGWSGDGSPGDGTLREFAIGAVTQHFPRTLARRPCSLSAVEADPRACDFRLPTEAELDALLAFQLFVGRDEEVNINTGDRFDTYVIEGEAGSGVVCLNGAAARLGQPGDLVIIVAYCMMDAEEAEGWVGRAVMVDKHNRVTSVEAGEKAGPLPAELLTV